MTHQRETTVVNKESLLDIYERIDRSALKDSKEKPNSENTNYLRFNYGRKSFVEYHKKEKISQTLENISKNSNYKNTHQQILLCLAAFKYYRQFTVFNKEYNRKMQENL